MRRGCGRDTPTGSTGRFGGTEGAVRASRGMNEKAYDSPSEVSVENGEVLVDGPNGVAVSLTPDAAVET